MLTPLDQESQKAGDGGLKSTAHLVGLSSDCVREVTRHSVNVLPLLLVL